MPEIDDLLPSDPEKEALNGLFKRSVAGERVTVETDPFSVFIIVSALQTAVQYAHEQHRHDLAELFAQCSNHLENYLDPTIKMSIETGWRSLGYQTSCYQCRHELGDDAMCSNPACPASPLYRAGGPA